MPVQFKSNKALFKADRVSFCAADCTCTDATDPTPPDPTLNTCASCKSPRPCIHLRACTPQRIKLVLTEPDFSNEEEISNPCVPPCAASYEVTIAGMGVTNVGGSFPDLSYCNGTWTAYYDAGEDTYVAEISGGIEDTIVVFNVDESGHTIVGWTLYISSSVTTVGSFKTTNPCSEKVCPPADTYDGDGPIAGATLDVTGPPGDTGCRACTDGTSLIKVSGTLAGTYTLEQDATQSCRWVLADDTPSLVVTGYPAGDCTGTGTDATRVEWSVTQLADSFQVTAVARFDSLKGAEFVLFSATGTGLLPVTGSVTVAGDESFPFACVDFTERGGGRLGTGGTATLSMCPDVPAVCHCQDSPTCIAVTPIVIPAGSPDFTFDDTATATRVKLTRSTICEWLSGTVSAAGVSNLQVKVKWYPADDTHAERGCGYYLYLYAFDGVDPLLKGVYFHGGFDAAGTYTLYDDYLDNGVPLTLSVSLTCATDAEVPSACTATSPIEMMQMGEEWQQVVASVELTPPHELWDGRFERTSDCEWAATPQDDADVVMPNDIQVGIGSITLVLPGGIPAWQLMIWSATPSLLWKGFKYTGNTPVGDYLAASDSPSAEPAFITVRDVT